MACLSFQDATSETFKNLTILKISDLYKVQYASLMWDYDHGSLPKAFDGFFTKVHDIHSYRTRSSVSGNLSQNVSFNTKSHGSKL